MGFKKLGLFFFVIILFQIQLHPLHTHPLQNTSTATTGTSPSHPFLLYYIFRFLHFHQFKARSLIVLLAFYSLQLSRRGVAFILHPCKQLLLFFSFFPSFFLQKKLVPNQGSRGSSQQTEGVEVVVDMEEVDMQATPQEAEHMAEGLMVMRGISMVQLWFHSMLLGL